MPEITIVDFKQKTQERDLDFYCQSNENNSNGNLEIRGSNPDPGSTFSLEV